MHAVRRMKAQSGARSSRACMQKRPCPGQHRTTHYPTQPGALPSQLMYVQAGSTYLLSPAKAHMRAHCHTTPHWAIDGSSSCDPADPSSFCWAAAAALYALLLADRPASGRPSMMADEMRLGGRPMRIALRPTGSLLPVPAQCTADALILPFRSKDVTVSACPMRKL